MLSDLDLAPAERFSLPLLVPVVTIILTLVTVEDDVAAAMLASQVVS